jgi:DNA-binding Lrp family transcriptional regulator
MSIQRNRDGCKNKVIKFDEIDKQIFNLLYKEGRMSLTKIGNSISSEEKEHYSHVSVYKRLKKQLKSGNMKIASYNPKRFNLIFCIVEIYVKYSLNDVIKVYSKCPHVQLILETDNQFNYMIGIIGKNKEIINHFIEICFSEIDVNAVNIKTSFSSNYFVRDFMSNQVITQNIYNEPPCGNNCKDCIKFLKEKCSGCPFIKLV